MSLVNVHMLGRQARLGEPGERPYADPFYWAPFVFYGAEKAL